MNVDTTFKHTDLSSPITEFALGLTALKDGLYSPNGTAIIIGPHLAMTAKHVIEDYWNQFDSDKKLEDNTDGTFSILAFQLKKMGKTGLIWNVKKIYFSTVTDIAFLFLTPHIVKKQDYEWRFPKIDLSAPRTGSRISCFGYHRPSIEATKDIVEWTVNPFTSCGEVKEVFQQGQGSLRPFPCMHTNARYDPSMSGGPVFNENGKLCGIICSGMDLIDRDKEPISYASLLWPAMLTEIDIDRKGFPKGVKYRALELARHGHIEAEGWKNIEIIEHGNSKASIQIKVPKKQ